MIVYKFQIRIGQFEIGLPRHFEVLSVGEQGGQPVVWIKLDDTQNDLQPVKFFAVMTGERFEDSGSWAFRGTVQILTSGGPFVLHLFEDTKAN